jgi:3',5'-cyclic AMP phosphodiesterase CpdA
MMHHAPWVYGLEHLDEVGMEGAAALEAVIRRHPQVERVLCGHVHRATQIRFGGTIASSCPSTAHQQALDLRHDGSDSFSLEPPGYQLTRGAGGSRFTHTLNVGEFAGPFPVH